MERAVTRPTLNRAALVRAAWIVAILAAFLASERQTLAHFWRIWEAPDTYYSHGPLVPILAVLMARMNLARLRQSPVAPSWLAVFFAAAAAILHVFGAATGFEELSGLAFLLAVFAVILCLRGLRAARVLLWPVLFLVAMIPLPQIALDSITARYQILSSFVAAQVLRMADGSVVAHGNVIVGDHLPGPLLIAPACSGLRLAIALVMCTWFLIYALQGDWRRKLVLGLLALPLGAAINAGRIVVIGWAAMRSGAPVAMHDGGGYTGLAACSVLLLSAAWLMGMRRFRDSDTAGAESESAAPQRSGFRSNAVAPALLVVLAFSALASTSVTGVYENLPRGSIDRQCVPLSLNGWRGTEIGIDGVTRKLLRNADLMSLVYRNPSAPGQDVYVLVDSAVDINMLHDPRLCLLGTGATVSEERIVKLNSPDPRLNGAPAWLLRVRGPDGPALMLCLYRTPGGLLPTKDAVNAYTVRARLDDLGRMCKSPTHVAGMKREVRARRITWYRFVTCCADGERGRKLLQDFAAGFVGSAMGPDEVQRKTPSIRRSGGV